MQRRRGNRMLIVALSTTSLILPAVTLIPLGSIWLWQHGYLMYWALAALCLVALTSAFQWWLMSGLETAQVPDTTATDVAPSIWTEREQKAWKRVNEFSTTLTPETVLGEEALKTLALTTIRLVSSEMHPGEVNPLWNFTLPEALLLAERVSARLRPVVLENVPLGDQITVRQFLRLYEWRIAVDWAERGYDIWRIVRLLNPVAAVTNEARERLTKKLYTSLKGEFTVRLAQGYVHEVAQAAIDLYSGRLRATSEPADLTGDTPVPLTDHGPFRWGRLGRQAKSIARVAANSLWRKS